MCIVSGIHWVKSKCITSLYTHRFDGDCAYDYMAKGGPYVKEPFVATPVTETQEGLTLSNEK
jgi:hypothetical protein